MESEFTLEYLSTLKRPQLQKLCKDSGLKASGKNNELIDRLLQQSQVALNETASEHFESTAVVNQVEMTTPTKSVQEETPTEQKTESPQSKGVISPVLAKLDIDITRATSTPEKRQRTKSVNNEVMEELAERAQQLMMDPEQRKLVRSKSFAWSKTDKKGKFDNVHQKQFNRMDSIANHYAAKRSTMIQEIQKSAVIAKKPSNVSIKQKQTLKRDKSVVQPMKPVEKRKSFLQKMNPFDQSTSQKENDQQQSANTQGQPNKKKFDLAASLARPLGYKPYKGKIKSTYLAPADAKPASVNEEKVSLSSTIKNKLHIGTNK